MNYLDPGDLFRIAEAAIGSPPTVRNPGLMGSAATLNRPGFSGGSVLPGCPR